MRATRRISVSGRKRSLLGIIMCELKSRSLLAEVPRTERPARLIDAPHPNGPLAVRDRAFGRRRTCEAPIAAAPPLPRQGRPPRSRNRI